MVVVLIRPHRLVGLAPWGRWLMRAISIRDLMPLPGAWIASRWGPQGVWAHGFAAWAPCPTAKTSKRKAFMFSLEEWAVILFGIGVISAVVFSILEERKYNRDFPMRVSSKRHKKEKPSKV